MKTNSTTQEGQGVVCIVCPNKSVYSETFIRAHIEHLPAKVEVLYGGFFPVFTKNGHPLLSQSFFHKSVRFAIRKIFGVNNEWQRNKALRNYLRKEKVEVVLAEFGPTGVSIMEACRAANIPLIVHFHGADAYNHNVLKDYGTKYSDMFQIASAIIVVSHDMKQQLLKLGVPKEKLFYNSCGADTSLFSYSDSALSLPVFISTGRFVEKKAPHLTIMSFKKVIESCPDARLLMIGDGPLWEACKQIVKVLGMTETVQFLGPLPHMEVASLMQKARAFVQHSVTTGNGDSEGTPVAVLEAGSSGLPVISTRHAGIQDAVLDGETGLLVDEFDIDGMAKHMIRLAEDSELATRLGSAARKHICSEFSMEKSINGLWRIIEQTLKE